MLVLSRRLHEAIIIRVGDIDIRVSIAEIERHKIRLAIEAPRQVPIFREELLLHPPAETTK